MLNGVFVRKERTSSPSMNRAFRLEARNSAIELLPDPVGPEMKRIQDCCPSVLFRPFSPFTDDVLPFVEVGEAAMLFVSDARYTEMRLYSIPYRKMQSWATFSTASLT